MAESLLLDLENEEQLATVMKDGIDVGVDGGRAFFKIDENPSTGYEWIIDPNGCTEEHVKVDQSFDPPAQFEGEEQLAGAPGTACFSFTGKNKGECTFRMAYARNWEFDWGENIGESDQIIEIPVSVV